MITITDINAFKSKDYSKLDYFIKLCHTSQKYHPILIEQLNDSNFDLNFFSIARKTIYHENIDQHLLYKSQIQFENTDLIKINSEIDKINATFLLNPYSAFYLRNEWKDLVTSHIYLEEEFLKNKLLDITK